MYTVLPNFQIQSDAQQRPMTYMEAHRLERELRLDARESFMSGDPEGAERKFVEADILASCVRKASNRRAA